MDNTENDLNPFMGSRLQSWGGYVFFNFICLSFASTVYMKFS